MLQQIRQILGVTDKDTLLTLLINQAVDEVIAYTHNEDCIEHLESTIVQMVIYKYNRLSNESLQSEDYSGVRFVYTSDYPDSIIRPMKAYRKIRVI